MSYCFLSQPPGGRPQVAMLACIGYIVPEYFRWPGDLAPAVLERQVAGFAGCWCCCWFYPNRLWEILLKLWFLTTCEAGLAESINPREHLLLGESIGNMFYFDVGSLSKSKITGSMVSRLMEVDDIIFMDIWMVFGSKTLMRSLPWYFLMVPFSFWVNMLKLSFDGW